MKFNLYFILFLFFFNCDNPIDINQSINSGLDDFCNTYDIDTNCELTGSCQWINNECVLMSSYLCTINYGGVIDDCGYCSVLKSCRYCPYSCKL